VLKPMLVWLLKVSVLAYLGLGLYLYLAQRSFMYFPVAEREASDVGVEYLANDGESIKLWVLGPASEKAVVYFGGNAEDVYYNAEEFRAALPGHTSYLVNYRGYGGSSGAPTEANLFADALGIYDALRERHAEITVIGRSLGSGVATYLASQRDVHRLILATPLDSALALAQSMYPVYPVSLLLKDRYKSVEYAPQIKAPTLIVLAEHDRVIPRKHSMRLVEAFAPGLVEQVVIANAGHNGLSGYRQYWQAFEDFLNP
jgi:pimeloyl-ACP methyl ester carboxylesterase